MERQLENFVCKRCGTCCTGHGFINVTDEECRRIAAFLDIPLETFLERYTHHDEGFDRYLIDGEGEDLPCIFLEHNAEGLASCRIQGDAKPRQCKTFPIQWRVPGVEKWCAGFQEEEPS